MPRETTFDEGYPNASYPAPSFGPFSSSSYDATQYASSSSGYSTPALGEYVQSAPAPHIAVPRSLPVPYNPNPSYNPAWAHAPQQEAGPSTSDLPSANYQQYPPDSGAYEGQYSQPNYNPNYPMTSQTQRQISPDASAGFVPSPFAGSSTYHSPPHTPEGLERFTSSSPHEGGEPSSALQQPQV